MRRIFLAMLVSCAAAMPAAAQQILGSGSTFCYPVLTRFIETYEKLSGVRILYQPIGSAAGIIEIRHQIVDFAVSEAPLESSQLLRDGLRQFPLVIGGIVPAVNIDGIAAGQLRFTGPLLAAIFLGKITNWNDPAIAGQNPGLTLPNLPILVVHRSDGSGTTFNWVNYLAEVSPEWKVRVGVNTSVAWPVGVGGKGNGGVAEKVAKARGAIGYIDQSYAISRKLAYGLVQNAAGRFVMPDLAGLQAATSKVDWTSERDFYVLLTNAAEPNAYPILATSFVLIRKSPPDPAHFRDTLGFFRWALENGQEVASSLGYLPLPSALVHEIEGYWQAEDH